uniref:Ig-like domain-containing protein n=1 Tax=Scophthalmus maximus TaxID=52904 RepID=A0A8D3AW92_SCOMX
MFFIQRCNFNMTTSPKFVFYLTCLLFWKMAKMNNIILSTTGHRDSGFISVHAGDHFTLQCLYVSNATMYYWYKQTLGQKPQLISTYYRFSDGSTFYSEFEDNPRFKQETIDSLTQLKISHVQLSDSATYYCARGNSFILEFMEGVTVSVKGSGLNIQARVHQLASETVQPGGSVTLSCTVQNGTCDGEHSVYWFKNSEEPHPGLIYTHGDRDDQCERKPNTQTHSCTYNLSMKSLDLSHAGTYYCAVASCGHVLFGNGTKLDFDNKVDCHTVSVYFISGALIFTTILSVLLAFLLHKRNCRICSESCAVMSPPSTANTEVYRDVDDLHYAALSVNLPNRSRRQRDNTMDECVYSSVRQ